MMDCRGMGAVTKKGRKGPVERKLGGGYMKPVAMKKGKGVKRKMQGKSY